MDVIDLTLILKSIGFRLESIDFNASRFSGGRIADWKADEVISSPAKSSANDSQFISVDISCGKSKIISRMSYRLSNDAQCTCPKQDATVDNSFWDIQSSGSFANHRPSLNAVAKKVSKMPHSNYHLQWNHFLPLIADWSSFRMRMASTMIRHRICCQFYRKEPLQWLKCWHKFFWKPTQLTLNSARPSQPRTTTSKGKCVTQQPFVNFFTHWFQIAFSASWTHWKRPRPHHRRLKLMT